MIYPHDSAHTRACAVSLILLCACLAACGSPRQAVYDPSKSHIVEFTRPRGCTDRDVMIVIDGAEHRFPDNAEKLAVKLPQGRHTILHYVGSYELRRWSQAEVIRDSFYRLGCFHD